MITPGSLQDWVMGSGVVGILMGFAAIGHRWMLSDTEVSSRPPHPIDTFVPHSVSKPVSGGNVVAGAAGRALDEGESVRGPVEPIGPVRDRLETASVGEQDGPGDGSHRHP